MKKIVIIMLGCLLVVFSALADDMKFESTSEGIVKQLTAKPEEQGGEVEMQSGQSMSFETNAIKVVDEKNYTQMANEYADKQGNPHVNLKVEFDTGSYAIRTDSIDVLEELATAMKSSELKDRKFAIGGHTDSTGSEEYNKILSLSRAKAVKEFLVTKGIESERLNTVGYGEEKPLVGNETAENRQLNRRVEIAVE